MYVGSNRLHFKTIDSTNIFAMELLSKTNPINGTVISTDFQTNGKGQIGRTWQSDPYQNLAFSIILYPHFLKPKDQFALSKAMALGVLDFLQNLNLDLTTNRLRIKWPNDIYINNKKICGILIQNILSGSTYKAAVVGIGLNVLQTSFSPSISNATSLKLSGFAGMIDESMYQNIFSKLDHRYKQLQENERKIDDDYQLCLYRINEWSNYCEADEDSFIAKFVGTDSIGRMILVKENDQPYHYSVGEIRMLI